MGNKNNSTTSNSNSQTQKANNQTPKKHNQIQKAHPYKVNLLALNVEIKLEGIKFQPSVYNIQEDKFVVKPFLDKQIRDSQFCYVSMKELSNASQPIISKYLRQIPNFDWQFAQVNDQWRLTRYHENGHFIQHCDREKQLLDHKHFGTQIFLPPRSLFSYEGGQLRITYKGQNKQYLPHETLWTHILLPLGIEHQVNKIKKGTRISFVKQIWTTQIQEPIQTDQDRQRRQIQERRRRAVNRDRMVLD